MTDLNPEAGEASGEGNKAATIRFSRFRRFFSNASTRPYLSSTDCIAPASGFPAPPPAPRPLSPPRHHVCATPMLGSACASHFSKSTTHTVVVPSTGRATASTATGRGPGLAAVAPRDRRLSPSDVLARSPSIRRRAVSPLGLPGTGAWPNATSYALLGCAGWQHASPAPTRQPYRLDAHLS